MTQQCMNFFFPATDFSQPKTTDLPWDVVIIIKDKFSHTLGINYANLVVNSSK